MMERETELEGLRARNGGLMLEVKGLKRDVEEFRGKVEAGALELKNAN